MGRRQGGKALGGGAMPFAAESWKRWRSLLSVMESWRGLLFAAESWKR